MINSPPFKVLNLIINGLPSKPQNDSPKGCLVVKVLNLIINGLPSKQLYHLH